MRPFQVSGRALCPEALAGAVQDLLDIRDGIRFPQIANGYVDAMARGVIAPLEAILRDGCAAGELVMPDTHRAARTLLAMAFSEPMHDAALGIDVARDDTDIEDRIGFALQIFMEGCAA